MSRNPITDTPKSQMHRDTAALGFYNPDGATLIRCELRAYQRGFQELLTSVDITRDDWWPLTCSQEALERWEDALALPLRPRATLEQRRETVRQLLSLSNNDRTPSGMQRALAAAGIQGTIYEDFEHRQLTVTVEAFGEEYDSVYQCMERARSFLPAHMTVLFEFGGPDWDGWEALYPSWQVFDDADTTWQQRDLG